MLISIITPTFNSEKTIAQVINSIKAQSYGNWEHIIIDNQSSDKTLEVVRSKHTDLSKVKIISEPDEGISDAFNKGVQASRGDVVTILNSDDYFIDENLLEKVKEVVEGEKVDFVHTDIFFDDSLYGSNRRAPLLCPINEAMPFNHPGLFIKKESFDSLGLFSKEFRYAMDYEWCCRMYDQKGNLKLKDYYLRLEKPSVLMRGGGVSWANEEKIVRDMKKALELHGLDKELSLFPLKTRLFRIKLKKVLSKLSLNFLVKLWRKIKWRL